MNKFPWRALYSSNCCNRSSQETLSGGGVVVVVVVVDIRDFFLTGDTGNDDIRGVVVVVIVVVIGVGRSSTSKALRLLDGMIVVCSYGSVLCSNRTIVTACFMATNAVCVVSIKEGVQDGWSDDEVV